MAFLCHVLLRFEPSPDLSLRDTIRTKLLKNTKYYVMHSLGPIIKLFVKASNHFSAFLFSYPTDLSISAVSRCHILITAPFNLQG
jgi:hypothetical protein